MKKRGQITLFIIIGVILLITIGLFFYLRFRTTVFEPTLVVPQEVIPIQRQIEECIYDVSSEGLELMGLQGGYITIPENVRNAPASYIGRGPNILPYWYYKGDYRVPSINEMEQELRGHVNASLSECTDFARFETSFDFEALERARGIERDVFVQIQEDDVYVELTYPLIIRDKLSNEETNLLRFPVRVPVRLRKAHELAFSVLNTETFDHFFEKTTINLMSIQPDIPFTSMEFKCGATTWRVAEIQTLLERMLAYNINRVRTQQTAYEPFEDPSFDYESLRDLERDQLGNFVRPLPDDIPSDTYEYFQFFLDAGLDDQRYQDFQVRYRYDPSFGMTLFANPSKDGVLQSDFAQGPKALLQFLCINLHHFTYDLDYPIETRILDPVSLNGRGYTFKFAFPVEIRNNLPDKSGSPPSLIEAPLQFNADDYCGARAPDPITVKVNGLSEDGFFEPLHNVNISLQCVTQVCSLGQTGTQPLGELRTFPPECGSPFIIAEKEGYVRRVEQMLDPLRIDIELDKAKAFSFDVVANQYFSGRTPPELATQSNDLTSTQEALVTFEYLPDDPNNRYSQVLRYPQDANVTLWIPEDGGNFNIDLLLTKSGQHVGGYTVTNVTITAQEIAASNHLTFRSVDYDPAPSGEAFADFYLYLGGQTYKEPLRPILSTR